MNTLNLNNHYFKIKRYKTNPTYAEKNPYMTHQKPLTSSMLNLSGSLLSTSSARSCMVSDGVFSPARFSCRGSVISMLLNSCKVVVC